MSEIKLTFKLEQFCNDLLTKCNNVSKTIRGEALADIKADVSNPDGEETRSIICRACTEAFGNVKYAAQRFMTTGRTEDNNELERLVSDVTIIIHPETVVAVKGEEDPDYEGNPSGYKIHKVDVQVLDKGISVEPTDYSMSSLGDGKSELVGEDLLWEFSHENNDIFRYTLYLKKGSSINKNFPFTVTYKDVKYNHVIKFRTVTDATQKVEGINTIEHMVYETVKLVLNIPNYNISATDTLKSHIHKYAVEYAMMQFLFDLQPDASARYKELSQESYNNIIAALNARENFTMRKASFI